MYATLVVFRRAFFWDEGKELPNGLQSAIETVPETFTLTSNSLYIRLIDKVFGTRLSKKKKKNTVSGQSTWFRPWVKIPP